MLVEIEQFKNMPVASMADDAQIGSVDSVLIHPETGELIGFWVKTGGWFSPKKALSSRDVVSYDRQALVVRTNDVLVSPDEVKPFSTIAKRKDKWLGKSVETELGKKLGAVKNLIIDTDLESLVKLEVKQLLGQELIISRNEIVKVDDDKIIVKDTEPTEKVVATSEASAA